LQEFARRHGARVARHEHARRYHQDGGKSKLHVITPKHANGVYTLLNVTTRFKPRLARRKTPWRRHPAGRTRAAATASSEHNPFGITRPTGSTIA
jgi:extradiol dioxygenase family protein